MAEEVKKESDVKPIIKGLVYGILLGTIFYVIGVAADPFVPGIGSGVAAAIGFVGGFALKWLD